MSSKVAAYLQEHIQGEVSTNAAALSAASTDMSVLEITPEIIVHPRVTSDIRKAARFAWQLAEKGHVLPLTVRGLGTDQTGGAIGKGVSIVLSSHMNRTFELDPKQKLIRLQPGVRTQGLNDALALQGLFIPAFADTYGTAGGMIGTDGSSNLSGKYGSTRSWVSQLEVVLANGDILQTERINKRELNRRKGMQTFEGEIYRAIDGLITDNQQLIDEKIASDIKDNVGYSAIAEVKQSDGSIDLTPLFLASQGTLGIVSEMILKAEFKSAHLGVAVLTFASSESARDAADQLRALEPTFLEYFDGSLFEIAAARGKVYDFYKQSEFIPQAALLIGFDAFGDRHNAKNLKRIEKLFADDDDVQVIAAMGEATSELLTIRSVTGFAAGPETKGASAPPLFDGVYIPPERFEEFTTVTKALADKHATTLPIHYRVLEGLVFTRPTLHLHKVGDKQKVFKLLDEYATLVAQFGGHLIADGAEGRTKAPFAYKQLDPEVIDLFASIKAIFDPYGILNPGVKQAGELRPLISALRADYAPVQSTIIPSYF